MNALARIQIPVETDEDRARDARDASYSDAVATLCPAARFDGTMWIRVRLSEMRDAATMGLPQTESDSAATILTQVMREAQQAVYAPFPAKRLVRILSALSLTMEAARALERVTRNG